MIKVTAYIKTEIYVQCPDCEYEFEIHKTDF